MSNQKLYPKRQYIGEFPPQRMNCQKCNNQVIPKQLSEILYQYPNYCRLCEAMFNVTEKRKIDNTEAVNSLLRWRDTNKEAVELLKDDDIGVFERETDSYLEYLKETSSKHLDEYMEESAKLFTNEYADSIRPTNPKDLIGCKKPRMSLIPPAAKVMVAKCMENGAKKYTPYNWRNPTMKVGYMNYLDAVERHISAFIDGEDNASDSGLPHLAHIASGVMVLLDAILCENAIDDRPKNGKSAELIEKFTEKPEGTEL